MYCYWQRKAVNNSDRISTVLGVATAQSPLPRADPIQWKDVRLVWVDQWPLTKEKLSHIHKLIQEQIEAGHIEPSNSPCNMPIFTIPKKATGKWRLLHDLRAVNATMHTMGALQPRLPAPSQISLNWFLIAVDLKDCFFTIPMVPQDKKRFAF